MDCCAVIRTRGRCRSVVAGSDGNDWFNAWVDTWADKITQFAYTYVHDRQLAEDITQDTFLRLYEWHYKNPDRPLTADWLYTTAHHRAIDYLRKARHERVSDTDFEPIGTADESWSNRLAVQAVLDHLPSVDRECLWLFYYADWSTEEIARHLGISIIAVRTRLSRARTRFSAIWRRD